MYGPSNLYFVAETGDSKLVEPVFHFRREPLAYTCFFTNMTPYLLTADLGENPLFLCRDENSLQFCLKLEVGSAIRAQWDDVEATK